MDKPYLTLGRHVVYAGNYDGEYLYSLWYKPTLTDSMRFIMTSANMQDIHRAIASRTSKGL